jgi:hypothetical protein
MRTRDSRRMADERQTLQCVSSLIRRKNVHDLQTSKSEDDVKYFLQPSRNIEATNHWHRHEENENVLRYVNTGIDKPDFSLVKACAKLDTLVPKKLDG